MHNGNLYCTVPSNLSYFQASPLNHSKLLIATLLTRFLLELRYSILCVRRKSFLNSKSLFFATLLLTRKSGANLYTSRKTQHHLKYSNNKEQTKRMICRKTEPLLLQLIGISLFKSIPIVIANFFHFSTSGLFAAAHDMKMEWLVVKGVCGFVPGSATKNNSWKTFACVMAASVVSNMLSNSCVFGDWPHYGGTC